ncbi:hypothetical protein ACFX1Q_040833 [Malus domestica]
MAERLHDLARKSIDSVGIFDGGADDPAVPLPIPSFSSMFFSNLSTFLSAKHLEVVMVANVDPVTGMRRR